LAGLFAVTGFHYKRRRPDFKDETVLPPFRRLPRPLVSRAPAAAACVLAALVADGNHAAGAQGRLEAEYVATVSGIPVGHGTWTVEISDKAYTAAASGATAGLLKIFSGARGTGASQGTMTGAGPVPTSYVATIVDDRHVDQVRIALARGNVTEFSAEPPLLPLPERIPVTDADRHGVVDPMTSALSRVGGSGDPVNPAACQRKVAVFDGRVRYDLHSEFKRIETVKAEHGYEGPAVVCALYFQPISGYIPDRAAVRYLVELRDAEVWLAPIAGTRVLAPFRVEMPTPLGPGILQAKQFVTTVEPMHAAQPTHAVAKTQ
jgi:hypothetical protein